jgi:hypothetical protein
MRRIIVVRGKQGKRAFAPAGQKQKIDYKDSDEAGSAPWISGIMLRGDIADDLCLACAEKIRGAQSPAEIILQTACRPYSLFTAV